MDTEPVTKTKYNRTTNDMSVRLEFKKGTKGKKYKVHVYKNNKQN